MSKCLRFKSGVNKTIDSGFVRYMNGCSEAFAVTVGVHQRSALSLLLFGILMDFWTENIRRKAS